MTQGRGPDDHEIDIPCPTCNGTGAGPVANPANAPADIIEKCAQICEAQGRHSPSIDGQSFYIATGQCAAAIRKLKAPLPEGTRSV
jgi:hypothetical protein